MSFVKVKSGGIWGLDGYEVDVEIDISPGIPSFNIVGLPDSAIKESKERVRSAIKNLGFSFPQKRITVNLSPSSMRKQGTLYDLPIAVGILSLSGYVSPESLSSYTLLGELSLDGKLNPVRGILPIVATLKEIDHKNFILPQGNALEGAVIEGVNVFGLSSLKDVLDLMNGELEVEPVSVDKESLFSEDEFDLDLADVLGQSMVKTALEISAAGAHNMSMIGAPGSGKSMIAKRVVTILPPLEFEEAIEVSRIYSVAGLLEDSLITKRPFRSPHHTSSDVALIGGGSIPTPGEISLAHRGVLFLDELPEFSRKTLEVLRQPMEDGYINISRSQGRVKFPASFTLITAQNPCPCGNYGNPFKECTCTPKQIKAYNSKVSQPIKDRIDLQVWVDPVGKEDLLSEKKGESSKDIRERVLRAYLIQKERFKKSSTDFNGRMTNAEVEKFCLGYMKGDSKRFLKTAMDKFNLSGRGYFRLLKVARTIADLEESEHISTSHLAQALQFRVSESLV